MFHEVLHVWWLYKRYCCCPLFFSLSFCSFAKLRIIEFVFAKQKSLFFNEWKMHVNWFLSEFFIVEWIFSVEILEITYSYSCWLFYKYRIESLANGLKAIRTKYVCRVWILFFFCSFNFSFRRKQNHICIWIGMNISKADETCKSIMKW